MSIRSKMSIARKGRTLRATDPRLSPEMEPETIRQMPMGGVNMPAGFVYSRGILKEKNRRVNRPLPSALALNLLGHPLDLAA